MPVLTANAPPASASADAPRTTLRVVEDILRCRVRYIVGLLCRRGLLAAAVPTTTTPVVPADEDRTLKILKSGTGARTAVDAQVAFQFRDHRAQVVEPLADQDPVDVVGDAVLVVVGAQALGHLEAA